MEKGQIRDVYLPGVGTVKAILVRKPKRRGGKYGFVPFTPNPRVGERIFYVAI